MEQQKPQSLRVKTMLIVGGSILGFLAVMYLFAGVILWQGFSQLEQREADANIDRIHNRIDGEMLNISSKVRDWASWDDAWDYIHTRSKTWAAGNLDPNTTLPNLNADLLAYITPKRELVSALQWDPFNNKAVSVDKEIIDLLLSEKFNATWSDWTNPWFEARGIVTIDGTSWLMAARPVTKTDHSGEIRGTFFLAERMTAKRIQTISEEMQFSMKLHERNDHKRKLWPTYTKNTINTGVLLQNYNATPAFSIEVKFNREVMQQGKLTLISMLALITAAGIGIAFLLLSLLDRNIIKRVDALRRGAYKISQTGSTKELLSDSGNDEIRALTSTINHMVINLEQRNNEIRDIFQNVKFGFFLTDLQGVIQKGHTTSSLAILNTEQISGRTLDDVLKFTREQKQLLELTLMQIIEDLIPDDISLNQLPKRVSVGDRTVSLEAALVRNAGQVPSRLLISIADATALEQAEQQNRSNQTVLTILRGKQAFASLLFDLKTRQPVLEKMAETGSMDQVRQELHTLNGNLRCFDLNDLVNLVTHIEDQSTIAKADITALFKNMEHWVSSHSEVTGIEWQQTDEHQTWEISDQFLGQIKNYDPISEDLQAFKDWIVEEIRTKPIHDLVSPLDNLVQTAAYRLGKKASLTMEGSELRTSPEIFQLLADVLPHMLRNAIDHGLESQEVRSQANKPNAGQIKVSFEKLTHDLRVSIQDDGQGIDVEGLIKKALSTSVMTQTEVAALSNEQKLGLIFHPKLSSKSSTGEFSGRGYGMAAVKEHIEGQFGGKIQIASEAGKGTTVVVTIPLLASASGPLKLAV